MADGDLASSSATWDLGSAKFKHNNYGGKHKAPPMLKGRMSAAVLIGTFSAGFVARHALEVYAQATQPQRKLAECFKIFSDDRNMFQNKYGVEALVQCIDRVTAEQKK